MAKYLDETGLAYFWGNIKQKTARAFATVAAMQAATDLAVGMVAHTNGFHTSGDGGAAYYNISASGTANGMDVLALQNSLYATLVVTEPYVTPEMYGAYGNGTNDDTDAVQAALSGAGHVKMNGTYLVTARGSEEANWVILSAQSNQTIEINGSIQLAPNAYRGYRILSVDLKENVKIFGSGSIVGDKNTHTGTTGEFGHCLVITGSSNVEVSGLTITQGWGDGLNVSNSYDGTKSENVFVHDCVIIDNSRNNVTFGSIANCTLDSCLMSGADRTAPKAGIDVEPTDSAYAQVDNLVISNCTVRDNGSVGIQTVLNLTSGLVSTISILGCVTNDEPVFVFDSDNCRLNVKDLTILRDSHFQSNFGMNIRCASGSYMNIDTTMYNYTDSMILGLYSGACHNVGINAEVYGTGFGSDVFRNFSGTPDFGNVNVRVVSHCPQSLKTDGPEREMVSKLQVDFTDIYESTTTGNLTLSSCGGDFLLTSAPSAVLFNRAKAQRGVRYVVRNKSGSTVTVTSNPYDSLANNHIGIYEVTEYYKVNKVADIAME